MEQREEIPLAVDGRYIACCKLCNPPSDDELYKCARWGHAVQLSLIADEAEKNHKRFYASRIIKLNPNEQTHK